MTNLLHVLAAICGKTNKKTTSPKTRLAVRKSRVSIIESLERREVFAAELLSAFSLGNDAADTSAKIVVDNSGNRYATGTFSGTIDFDPSRTWPENSDLVTAAGATDAYIAKYDANDELQWVRRIGNTQATTGAGIAQDGSGNLIVVGSYQGTVSLGASTLVSQGGKDVFAAKLAPTDGSVLWGRSWGTALDELPSDLVVGSANDAIVATRTVPVGNLYVTRAIGLTQFTSQGAIAWSKSMPMTVTTTSHATILGLDVHANGDIAIGGSQNGTIDFDPSSKTRNISGSGSAFVATYSQLGALKWVSTFQETSPNSGSASAYDVEYDAGGNLIVGGSYKGDVDFDPSRKIQRLQQGGGFLAKLTSNGSLLWARALYQTQTPGFTDLNTLVRSIDIDASGVIYAGGIFYNTVDFDPASSVVNRTSVGGRDVFFMSLDATGGFRWVETAGGSGDDFAEFQIDASGVIHVSGGYMGDLDIDPSAALNQLETASGRQRAFIARWRRV